ncbi:GNAT family N-acetyltransferase [Streptomyces sp. NPDC051554]|uniref:GNAT family N-acetyltransferase n=1 Tax=Streptomyces sp. NPDC051554 TaxID=3365656 RepID=UPI0037A0014F
MPWPSTLLQLETARSTLHPWTASDADAHRELVAERGDGIARRAGLTDSALLAVIRRDVGDFIEYYGLTVGRASVDEPEIAYELFRCVHGQGFAIEAGSAIIEAAIAAGQKRLYRRCVVECAVVLSPQRAWFQA